MPILRQSTSITLSMGPFLDNVDGNTERTGLTISQSDVRLSKNGGTYAQKNDSNAASHQEKSNYAVALNATDTATPGRLRVYIHPTSALPVWQDFMVITSNAYEAFVSGGEFFKVDVQQFGTTAGVFSAGIPYVNVAYVAGSAGAATLLAAGASYLDASINSRATQAEVSAAVSLVLSNYDVATSADVSAIVSVVANRALVNRQVPSSAEVSAIVKTALTNHDVATSSNVSAVVQAIVSFGGATQNQVSIAVAQALADRQVPSSAAVSTIIFGQSPFKVELVATSTNSINDRAFTVSAAQRNADFILRRGVTAAEASQVTDDLQVGSLIGVINRMTGQVAVSASSINIYRADRSTVLGTQDISTTVSSAPIAGITPR